MTKQSRIDYIVAHLSLKFLARASNDMSRTQAELSVKTKMIVDYLTCGDPSPNKQYTQWLIKAYTNGSGLEDLVSRGTSALARFEQLKSKKLLPVDRRDIGKLEDLRALEDLVESISPPEEELRDKGKHEEILNNGEVRVIIPLDAVAARYYGQGTRWCTASKNNNMFQNYHDKGYLIILLPKQPKHAGEKYQIHFQDDQWMDEKDQPIERPYFKHRFPSLDLEGVQKQTYGSYGEKVMREWAAGTINPAQICSYARHVLGGRWSEAEPVIMKSPYWAFCYARKILKNRWPEAEPYIMEDVRATFGYTRDVIRDRWPEAEPIIMKDPLWAVLYAQYVIKGRWLEAEPIIYADSGASYTYINFVHPKRMRQAA